MTILLFLLLLLFAIVRLVRLRQLVKCFLLPALTSLGDSCDIIDRRTYVQSSSDSQEACEVWMEPRVECRKEPYHTLHRVLHSASLAYSVLWYVLQAIVAHDAFGFLYVERVWASIR